MKILQLRSEFRDNGPGSQALTLAKELRSRGASVCFVASGGILEAEIRREGFEFFVIETLAVDRRSLTDVVNAIRALRKILRMERPDVIHAHNAASIMLAALASWSIGLRPALVQSVRGIELRKTHQWRNWIYRINPARLLAVSQFTLEQLLAIGARRSKIHVTLNGVDLQKFNPESVEKDQIRRELGLPVDAMVIGHVGNFSGWKGQEILVEAVATVRSRIQKVQVVLVGDGPARQSVEAHANHLGVDDIVSFLGFRRDIAQIQSAIDLYCQPSTEGEMFPNAIIEAMAMGNPWVGSNISGLGELTAGGAAGDLVAPGDVGGLASILERRLADPTQLRQRGQSARAFVLENLKISDVVDRIERAYRAGGA